MNKPPLPFNTLKGKLFKHKSLFLKFFLRLKISYSKQKVQTYQNEKTNKKKMHYLLFQVKSHMLDFTFISVCSFFSFFFFTISCYFSE